LIKREYETDISEAEVLETRTLNFSLKYDKYRDKITIALPDNSKKVADVHRSDT